VERSLISIRDAAKVLGISYWQALRLAHQGELPVVRLGKRYLVKVPRMHEWLRGHPETEVRHDRRGA